MHRGECHYLGSFRTAEKAAEAYDRCLRALSSDPIRLQRCLNFPSAEEVAFKESPAQARQRGISLSGNSCAKESQAFDLLRRELDSSPHSANYEICRLSGASRADAIFHLRSASMACGTQLQLKAATSRGRFGRYHVFRKTAGYHGMLIVFVSLDQNCFWAVPGSDMLLNYLSLTVGTDREKGWRAPDIASVLVRCFQLEKEYPHVSPQEALLQCAPSHRTEALAHRGFESLLRSVGIKLARPDIHQSSVDSVLVGCQAPIRVQEKACRLSKQGVYRVHLCRHAGALGRSSYEEDDFDMLAASILDRDEITGVFLIPMSALVEHGFVADKPKTMRLCPPWLPPQRSSSKVKYAWQQQFFLDLRSWQDRSELPMALCQQLWMLISPDSRRR